MNIKSTATLFAFILLSSLGFISTDIYITSLPEIAKELNASETSIQNTISLYFIGLAVAQLFYAPLSNRYGKKNCIYVGLLIYIISCTLCFCVNSIQMLILARLLQAIGSCSGIVLGRAIICELYDTKNASKILATVYPFVGMSPAVFPVVGGFIAAWFGWRANFIFLIILGIMTFIFTNLFVLESGKQDMQSEEEIGEKTFYSKKKSFILFLLAVTVICLADGAYFSYVIKSPFIFSDFGYSYANMGLLFLPTAVSFFIGNFCCRYCLNKASITRILVIGGNIFIIALITLLLIAIKINYPYLYVISMSFLTFANGFLIPCGTSYSLSILKKNKATISSILGFLQLLLTGTLTIIASFIPVYFMPFFLLILGVGVFISTQLMKTFENNRKLNQRCISLDSWGNNA